MRLREIEAISKAQYDPKANQFYIHGSTARKYQSEMKPLPGGSGLTYVVNRDGPHTTITILDPKRLGGLQSYYVGTLIVKHYYGFPKGYVQVFSIAVHPNYRGMGIARALYGLVLLPEPQGMGLTLISDQAQTPGGIQNWVSLSKIPGVEVTGLVRIAKIDDAALANFPRVEKQVDQVLDDLFGKVGGVYLSETEKFYFFQIPVELVGSKLENKVKDSMIKIYPSAKQELIDLGFRTFLMAQYGNSV